MKTQYFTRYGVCEEHLQCDAERGYSFNSYHFDETVEGLLEDRGYDLYDEKRDDWMTDVQIQELADELNVRQHSTGEYGFALAGLCGWECETLQEAETFMEGTRGGLTYGAYPYVGIYEGVRVGMDNDSTAELFRPVRLVKVIKNKYGV